MRNFPMHGKNIIVDGKRYDSDKLRLISRELTPVGTGITREEVWMTKRSKTVIIGYDSIWESRIRPGECVGGFYQIASEEEIAALADEFDDEELLALVPEGE